MKWSKSIESRELNVYVEKIDEINGIQVCLVPFGGGGMEVWNPSKNEEPFFDDPELWEIVEEGMSAVS